MTFAVGWRRTRATLGSQAPSGPALLRCSRSARATPSTAATTTSTLYAPQDFSSYEGVIEPEGPGVWFDPEVGNDPRWQKRWKSTERVELRLTPTRIVFLRRKGASDPAATR